MTKKKKTIYTIKLIRDNEKFECRFKTEINGNQKVNIVELFGLLEVYKYTFFEEAGISSKEIKDETKN